MRAKTMDIANVINAFFIIVMPCHSPKKCDYLRKVKEVINIYFGIDSMN
jgi:hypothetical protein